jgi:hypothetical protein
MSYNPKPPRVWSRVQDQCSYDSSYNYNEGVYVPLTGKTVSQFEANYQAKVLYKGNILQYKKNSSSLTKSQRYSQICKGLWTNRTKSYATQTQTYTNPNTSNLLRVNYNSVPSPGTSYIPGPYNYNIPNPYGCKSDTIKDGGSLVCNKIANPCTDEVIQTTTVLNCYPTTCSDVPGTQQILCWDPQLETWYPRQRYIMPTSGSKWPEGYKGFVSAVTPPVPVLTLESAICDSVTLSWTVINNNCIPISSYNIYVNGQIYTTVSYTTTTITINNLSNGNNSFYVTSVSSTIESDKSNSVSNISYTSYTTNGIISYSGNYTYVTFLTNGTITFNCPANIQYTIVGGGASGGDCGTSIRGGTAGGGGEVLTNSIILTNSDTLNITIGNGGTNPSGSGSGVIGEDTSITSLYSQIITTNNITYSGGGGGGDGGSVYPGGGGIGNNITSANGGIFNLSYSYGTGGASGSQSGNIFILGNVGQGNSSSSAGNGGDGIQGIDGNYYGGGGGGGGFSNIGGGGKGGIGGGGNGSYYSTSIATAANGAPNTGGGGGGGFYSAQASPSGSSPGNGGSGIAILKFLT